MESVFKAGISFLLPMYSSTFLAAIEYLQQQQSPPYSEGVFYLQILQRLKKTTLIGHLNQAAFDPLFIAYFKLDLFYASPDMTLFSIVKLDDSFMKFSEGIRARYPGHTVDENELVVSEEEKDIELEEIMQLLLSKDLKAYEQLKPKFFFPTSRFLNPDQKRLNYTYTSFPRSGNTFLRKQFESILGLATGSDMVMLFQLNVSLQFAGFKGEGVNDSRVLINKSHFPARFPYDKSYATNAIVVCVRNPLDVFVSAINFLVTLTHNKQISEDFHSLFPSIWNTSIKEDVKLWKMWHEYWIEKAEKLEMPVFFVRYEDVLKEPTANLKNIFKFLFAQESLEGTVLAKRIEEATEKGPEEHIIYTPRVGSFNKNLKYYSEEHIEFIKEELEELLHYWGYTAFPGNRMGFFDYKGKAKTSSVEQFERFREVNKRTMEMVLSKGYRASDFELKVNGPNEGFKWIKEKSSIFDLAYIQNVATIKQ